VLSTLKNKYYDLKNNKITIDNKEHRGGYNKIFNDEQELNIFSYLKNNFIDKNEMLCDELIKLHALNTFKLLNNNKIFNASSGWCNVFKNKFKMSTVRCSIFRKTTHPYTAKELNELPSGSLK